MSDPTAEELQQKLEGIRKMQKKADGAIEQLDAMGLVPGPVEGLSPDAQYYTCTKCGNLETVDESSLKLLEVADSIGLLCKTCWIEKRHEGTKGPAPATPLEKTLAVMEKLGVNVRRHGHLSLDQLDDQKAITSARSFITDFLKVGMYREMSGLWVYGNTGTGKSQLAVCILRDLIKAAGLTERQVVYDRGRAMVTQLQDCYGKNSVDPFSERRRKARLWIYEDAGTEKLTPDSFRVMEDIFDRREGHPTIVTSNLTRNQFSQRWEEMEGWGRLKSRLAPFKVIHMEGKDLRFT